MIHRVYHHVTSVELRDGVSVYTDPRVEVEEIEVLDDERVQRTLKAAEELLWIQLDGANMDDNPRLWVAFTVLRSVRIYAKSSNSIPGYMGLDLNEAMELAEAIIANPPKSDRDLTIHSYKHLASGITLANHS